MKEVLFCLEIHFLILINVVKNTCQYESCLNFYDLICYGVMQKSFDRPCSEGTRSSDLTMF